MFNLVCLTLPFVVMMMMPSTLSRGTLGVRMEGPLPKHTERAWMLGTRGCGGQGCMRGRVMVSLHVHAERLYF